MPGVGHTINGKFAPGNKFGKGNPHAQKVAKLRAALIDATSESDVYAIVTKLIDQAKEGDVMSAREVLDRTIGKAQANDTLTITGGDEEENPFFDYLRNKPELARAASALLRSVASDTGFHGVASEPREVDVAGSSGPAVEQAVGSRLHAREEPDGDDAAAAREVGDD